MVEIARQLAEKPFKAPPNAPEELAKLDYSTYRQINFQENAAIWGKTPTKFSVQLFAPGFLYKDLIEASFRAMVLFVTFFRPISCINN